MIGRCWLRLEWYGWPEAAVLREALGRSDPSRKSGERNLWLVLLRR
jgi:hypothetical protein